MEAPCTRRPCSRCSPSEPYSWWAADHRRQSSAILPRRVLRRRRDRREVDVDLFEWQRREPECAREPSARRHSRHDGLRRLRGARRGLFGEHPRGLVAHQRRRVVAFTDKLNAVRISAAPAHGAVTVASVRQSLLPKLGSSVKGYKLQSVSAVKRTAGRGGANRLPRLLPARPGHEQVRRARLRALRLPAQGPRGDAACCHRRTGSDNVDPWKKVTNSLAFTR